MNLIASKGVVGRGLPAENLHLSVSTRARHAMECALVTVPTARPTLVLLYIPSHLIAITRLL